MATEPGGDHPPVVRRRRRRPVWPWLAGLAVLLLGLFLIPIFADEIASGVGGGPVGVTARSTDDVPASPTGAVSSTSSPAAAATATGAVAAPSPDPPRAAAASPSPSEQMGAPLAVTIDQLVGNPDGLYGRTVAVSGEVVETLGPRTLRLAEDETAAGEAVLVAVKAPLADAGGDPASAGYLDTATVRVTGVVRRLDLAALEEETGYSLDRALYAAWIGQPVIVASSLALEPSGPGSGTATPAASPSPAASPAGGAAGPSIHAPRGS